MAVMAVAAVDVIVTRFVQQGVGDLVRDFSTIGGHADKVENRLRGLGSLGVTMAGMGAGMTAGMALFGKAALDAAGQMQQIEAGFATMLGGTDAAKAKIQEIQKFAAETPFDFVQSAKAGQKLLAMGVTADQLIPTMTAVGNAVAAAGGGSEEFSGVLNVLGQINTKGKLVGEEIRQMAERGIPAAAILKRELGLTNEQMADLGSAGIDSGTAIAALLKGFQADFGGGMAAQMKTLPGQMSMLTDAWNQFLVTAAQPLLPLATEAVKNLTDLVTRVDNFVKAHPDVIKIGLAVGGIGSAALITAGAVLKVKSALDLVKTAADIVLPGAGGGAGGGGAGMPTWDPKAKRWRGAGGGRFIATDLALQLLGMGGAGAGTEAAGAGVGAAGAGIGASATALASGLALAAVTAYGINETLAGIKNTLTLSDEDLRAKGIMGQFQASAGKFLSDQGGMYYENKAGDKAEAEAMRLNALSFQRAQNRRFGQGVRGANAADAAPRYGASANVPYATNPEPPAVLARNRRIASARSKSTVTVEVSQPYGPGDYAADDRAAYGLQGYS